MKDEGQYIYFVENTMRMLFDLRLCLFAFIFLLIQPVLAQATIEKSEPPIKIAFTTFTEQHGWQVWFYDIANQKHQRLTQHDTEAYSPTFSAQGDMAFSDHNGQIWWLGGSGSAQSPNAIKRIDSLPKNCGHPALSSSGEQLLCVCFTFNNRSEDSDLYIVDMDSQQAKRLLTMDGVQKHPAWSTDGKRIAFSTGYREMGERVVEQLWMMDLQQKVPVKLVDNGFSNINPSWSADGKKLAYSSNANGTMDIWIYDIAARRSWAVTAHPGFEGNPIWSRTDDKIVFTSTQAENLALWVQDLRSGVQSKILVLEQDIHDPVWYPQ